MSPAGAAAPAITRPGRRPAPTRTPTKGRSGRAGATAPARSPRSGGGRHLVLVEQAGRPHRRVRWGALSLMVLLLAVFGVVVFQALLVQAQGRLDEAERTITSEQARAKQMRLELAQLESPERIAEAARGRLGMIVPAESVYLRPEPTDEAKAALDPATVAATTPATTAVPTPSTSTPPSTRATLPTTRAATPTSRVTPPTTRATPPTTVRRATPPTTTKTGPTTTIRSARTTSPGAGR